MRSTLFYIPHEIGGLPLFGAGWALMVLTVFMLVWAGWVYFHVSRTTQGQNPADKSNNVQPLNEILAGLPFWGVAAALIWFVLPSIEQAIETAPGEPPIILGLPIRGYGVMVLIGLLSGIAITTHRGRQLGLSSDLIVGLGFWMMIGGVAGARMFYVIQNWGEEFAPLEFTQRIIAIVKLTEGGLVIYGGILGGIIAGAIYCRKHRQPTRAMADLIAPGFLIGLAFGRIGCLLNGCCFGGVCTANLPTIDFPQGSSPYMVQLESGKLLGIELTRRDHGRTLPESIASVESGSIAEDLGIKPGDTLKEIRPFLMPNIDGKDKAAPPKVVANVAYNETVASLESNELPPRSLPVQPAQIYAAINAALLCCLIWCIQPWPNHDGIAFSIAIILKGTSRFFLEGIRSDEAGQLGTSLSIAQILSIGGVLVAGILIIMIQLTPKGRAWKWR